MNRFSRTILGLAGLALLFTAAPNLAPAQPLRAAGQEDGQTPMQFHVIPSPVALTPGSGTFELSAATTIAVSSPDNSELASLAGFAADLVRSATGLDLTIAISPASGSEKNAVLLLLSSEGSGSDPEGYKLEVGPNSVTISASAGAGLFYGLQTLRQLIGPPSGTNAGTSGWSIPAVHVEDRPRFVYRGMHLDVGRHFFPVEFVKKYIDLLAMYKMNTFHWHLTEDQGWRIEIEKYPRLTQVGAFRKETILARNFDPYIGDRKPYGGYYTQDEVREVVAYASRRYVNVIPEIEMPGHSSAALAAYPELACTEGPFEVATVWGVHQDIFCPSEQTFAFLEDVLTEVLELFPSRYIHIGGDEAPKRRWQESDFAQEVIRREGLADEHELQSYFIRRIERFLLANGRRLIGWDEILEGGLAPQATVMSWRGTTGGIEAARQGHDVIMTPTSHVYFDYYQGDPLYEPLTIGGYTPLEKVYSFEPVPDELTSEEAKHVLGAQGNVWTEYMKTPQYVEYMVFPRMLALSEVVWSPAQARDWNRFASSLTTHFHLLDGYRVNYRVPSVAGLERDRITLDDRVTVALSSPLPESRIRYTTDGSDPTEGSPLYAGPFDLPVDEDGVQVSARAFLHNGKASPLRSARFARASLRPSAELESAALAPGLRYAYYEAQVSSVDQLRHQSPVREGAAREVGFQGSECEQSFGLEFAGYVRAPTSGVYTFYLRSDDGSELRIGGAIVVDNDGYHGAAEETGTVALEAGYHPVTVRYFQASGGKTLSLAAEIEGPEGPSEVELAFAHER
jgi:hexosaminidase